ncbi:MAG TPA: hypothetical protein VMV87_13330 [Burkholderiales bacterium]|nr:hypothetical protein [Burkholderiales bacterium]
MGALGHYLEEEGIPTTQISLVREHTAAMNPPRALWVSFILGRPLGVPNDAAFQRRVLLAVLGLLEAKSGPVLEDYPEDAPRPLDQEPEGFACPFTLSRPPGNSDLASELQREVAELVPWHELSQRKRGRTTAGMSGLSAEAAARFVTDFIADPSIPGYRDDLTPVGALRLVCHDLKAYYFEAAAAQPGARAAMEAEHWFWRETVIGQVFLKLRELCMAGEDKALRHFGAKNVVPMAISAKLDEVR